MSQCYNLVHGKGYSKSANSWQLGFSGASRRRQHKDVLEVLNGILEWKIAMSLPWNTVFNFFNVLFLCLYIDSFTVFFAVSHQYPIFWLFCHHALTNGHHFIVAEIDHQLQIFVWGTHIPSHTFELQTYPHSLLQCCLLLVFLAFLPSL